MNHIHHLGLDEMEIYATFLYEELLIWVDFDNSNQFFIWDYTCIKVENPRYEYQILFSKENINLFSYFKGSKGKSKIETKDYVVFYGSCFRVHGKDFVFDTLLSFFRLSDTHIFRRFDICVDFLLPISTILSKFKERGQKGADFYGSKWEIETEYIWEKKNSKNTSTFGLSATAGEAATVFSDLSSLVGHTEIFSSLLTSELLSDLVFTGLRSWLNCLAVFKMWLKLSFFPVGFLYLLLAVTDLMGNVSWPGSYLAVRSSIIIISPPFD